MDIVKLSNSILIHTTSTTYFFVKFVKSHSTLRGVNQLKIFIAQVTILQRISTGAHISISLKIKDFYILYLPTYELKTAVQGLYNVIQHG